jgi:hypothetical protein
MYYADCSILEATTQKTMAYTWRIILQGIELLKDRRVRTLDEMEKPVMVSGLIDHGTSQWDVDGHGV